MKLSTRLLRKGALVDETRVVLRNWESGRSVPENIERAFEFGLVGTGSEAWRREIILTLSSRLTEFSESELLALTIIARSNADAEAWRGCLHWHCSRADTLYYAFVTEWLFAEYRRGAYRLRSDDVLPVVDLVVRRCRKTGTTLSEYGRLRAARDLLRMAKDFGILSGASYKEFVSYHLPEASFIYVLHHLIGLESNARRVIDSPDWHMFLMDATDVERELLRLHQFHKLHYESAGSLAQLKLPCDSPTEYARGLSA